MFRRIFDALKGLLNRLVNTPRLENVEARLENVEERLQIGADLLIGLQANVLKWNERMEASDETDSQMKDILEGIKALILLLMDNIRGLKKNFHKDQKSLLDGAVKMLNNADEQFEALRKSVKTLEEKFKGLVHHFDGDIGSPPISREGSVSPSVSPSDIEAANHFLAGLLVLDRDVVGGAAVSASNGAAAGSADRARRWGSAETKAYHDDDDDCSVYRVEEPPMQAATAIKREGDPVRAPAGVPEVIEILDAVGGDGAAAGAPVSEQQPALPRSPPRSPFRECVNLSGTPLQDERMEEVDEVLVRRSARFHPYGR